MKRRHLLHIDNSEDDLFLFRRAFEKSGVEGWELRSAEGGQAAIEYLSAAKSGSAPKPALVLLDLKMPIVNGFAVLEWVRQNDIVPIVILSSSELKADEEQAIALGACGYIQKEETFTEVADFVRAWNA